MIPLMFQASYRLKAAKRIEGRRKELFLQFMQKMLQWAPEDRQNAVELSHDPWLNNDVD